MAGDAHRDLWRSVLARLVLDAVMPLSNIEQAVAQNNALTYFFRRTPDFDTVAELAGYDPDVIYPKICETIERRFAR